MGNYWTNPVRYPADVGLGVLRRTITLADFQANNGLVPIGALEAGTMPGPVNAVVQTAFNSGTSDAVDIGTASTAAGFAPAASTLVAATGVKRTLTGTLTELPLASDTVVYAKYTSTGTPPTTGKVTFTMSFTNKREGEGIPFPNN